MKGIKVLSLAPGPAGKVLIEGILYSLFDQAMIASWSGPSDNPSSDNRKYTASPAAWPGQVVPSRMDYSFGTQGQMHTPLI